MNKPSYLSGVLQVKAYKALQARVAEELAKYELNSTQWFVVGQIMHNKDVRTADLAAQLSVDPPLITVLTDDLAGKGIIKKTIHPKDKRVRVLKLTATGQALAQQVEKSLNIILRGLLEGVSPKELEAYGKVLQAIVDNAGRV